MKITLKSFIKVLVQNNYKFVIEKCEADLNIIRFVLSNTYPQCPYMYIGDNQKIESVKNTKIGSMGQALADFDTSTDQLIACTVNIFILLKEMQNVCIANKVAIPPT